MKQDQSAKDTMPWPLDTVLATATKATTPLPLVIMLDSMIKKTKQWPLDTMQVSTGKNVMPLQLDMKQAMDAVAVSNALRLPSATEQATVTKETVLWLWVVPPAGSAKQIMVLPLVQKLVDIAKVYTAWLLDIVQVIVIKVFHLIAPAVVVR
jgi:hypothetical protein